MQKRIFMHRFSLRNILILLLPLLWWTVSSCKKEKVMADTVPDFYTLPQGNQPYDDSIVAFHKKYGSYILYKFTQQDLRYDYTWIIRVIAPPGNPAYIANTLQFFKSQCLDFYPESFLQKTMPVRIMLAASLDTFTRLLPDTARSYGGFVATSRMLCIGWTDSTLMHLSPARFKETRGFAHRAYAWQAAQAGSLKIPADFMKYIPDSYLSVPWDVRTIGLVEQINLIDDGDRNVAWDFAAFVGMITRHSKAELDTTFLSPSYDTKGLILAKYNVVIRYYKEQGIDLQAIGNLP
ncbi:hypothetical protein HGH93_05690 [Chitinophaga polysaccharea]|uniref:hypothetical protein n=1 Tax=Chitinophaga TaxID=79328 RepID=UPI001455D0DE|nr:MULTISPECIES: hypothetical protein [Chitinophaga]NLR57580.1 hypothetical protein [Chitinophaga polysaccharea]NLU95494.1 hypothetical protein [Chitinophaga sp. Ak27]